MNKKRVIVGISTVAFILLLAAASAFASGYVKRLSLQQVKAALESMGGMAWIAFIMLCILRALVFVPCGLMSALGGMIFGTLLGTVLTLVGLTAGSVVTFFLARWLGRGWVQRVLGKKYQSYESYISKDSFGRIFMMRVLPVLPFDAVSCISGVSEASITSYIMATLAGSLPGVFIYVSFGDSVRSMSIKRIVFSIALIAAFILLNIFYRHLAKTMGKSE